MLLTINIIVFFILTVMGFYFLAVRRVFSVKGPINKQEKFIVNNHQYLLLFFLATAILACGSMMANRLMICVLICFLSLFFINKGFKFSVVWILYLIYLLYLIISLIQSPVTNYGFRQFLKYLYPFLLMIFASRIPTSGVFYLKAIKVVLAVALLGSIWLILQHVPLINRIAFFFDSLLFWGPAVVDFLPVGVVIALSLYSVSKEKKYLAYSALFILPSILWAWRTGILASSIAIVVFSLVRYKLKSVPYVIVGCFVLVGSVLFIPSIRTKMFMEQMSADEVLERRGELSVDDINSSARFAMWEWSLDNYYKGNELFGSGLGILQYAFYERDDNPYTDESRRGSQHNDYVQILCDTGLVGLILYLLVFISLIAHSFFVYFNRRSVAIVKLAALISGAAMAGMVSTLYTDNVVTYSMMTLSYPFALYGLMLGLKNNYRNAV